MTKKQRYRQYEREKAKLRRMKLDDKEYEKRLREIVKRLKL